MALISQFLPYLCPSPAISFSRCWRVERATRDTETSIERFSFKTTMRLDLFAMRKNIDIAESLLLLFLFLTYLFYASVLTDDDI